MRVIECRPQDLTTRRILIGGRNPARDLHCARIEGQAGPEAGQGGAVGAYQKDRLYHIAARLFEGQRRQIGIVQRAFGHHPIHSQRQLFADLRNLQLWHSPIPAPRVIQPGMRIFNGALAPFDSHIHHMPPI